MFLSGHYCVSEFGFQSPVKLQKKIINIYKCWRVLKLHLSINSKWEHEEK